MIIVRLELYRIKKTMKEDKKDPKKNIPTPEPPQRIYPVPESAKVKSKEKREPNVKENKK